MGDALEDTNTGHYYCDVLADDPQPPALPPPRIQRPHVSLDSLPRSFSVGHNFKRQASATIPQNNNRCCRNAFSKMNVALMFAVAFFAILSTVFAAMYFTIDKKDKTCSGIDCPYGWTSLSSSCYFFSTTKTTWPEARDDCLKRGGDLVVPTNANEDTAIWNEVNQRKLSDPWIGISRSDVDNQFYTVYGSKVSYTNWLPGEPNYPKTEHCGSYWTRTSTGAFGWNNEVCSVRQFHFICELQRTRS